MGHLYLIRADGNARIGMGHLMRCLAVAIPLQELLQEGDRILFLCANEESEKAVRERGFSAQSFGTDYIKMEEETPCWEKLLFGETSDVTILVDSYFVTDDYLQMLRKYGKTALFDDFQNHYHPVDLLINYHVYADEKILEGLYPEGKEKLLLGAGYVPLRKEFQDSSYVVRNKVHRVLLTTGGGDAENIAGQILRKLFASKWGEKVHFHVVAGRFHPALSDLKKMEEERENLIVSSDVNNMAELFQESDLAITAGGTTIYEISAVGVPFICFSYAENQELLTEYMGKMDIGGFAGAFHKNREKTLAKIETLFTKLCENEEMRQRYSQEERKLVDGRGALRIAVELAGGRDTE